MIRPFRNRRIVRYLVTVSACVVSLVSAALAEGGVVRFSVLRFSPTGDWQGRLIGETVTVEADSAVGAGLSYELRPTHRWGVETAISLADVDFNLSVRGAGSAKLGSALLLPLTFGLNFHPLPAKSRTDLYVGPMLGWVFWGNLRTDSGDVEADSEFTLGAQVGVAIAFSSKSRWSFDAAVQYLRFPLADQSISVDVDPFVLRVGLASHF
ncbi:MAG: OmpW family outer membrane protein [Acidobacteriota bacterium]